ncbi:hypothetical protein P8452_43915 [Trifolium repens]|nr:hypothetical protein P8452_43915 [Trifolium repens]
MLWSFNLHNTGSASFNQVSDSFFAEIHPSTLFNLQSSFKIQVCLPHQEDVIIVNHLNHLNLFLNFHLKINNLNLPINFHLNINNLNLPLNLHFPLNLNLNLNLPLYLNHLNLIIHIGLLMLLMLMPVGEAAGLLAGYLGFLASNDDLFPIMYRKWPKVPTTKKDLVYETNIKAKFVVNDQDHRKLHPDTMRKANQNAKNRQKQCIPHTLGRKSLARTRDDMEKRDERTYSRGDMYEISHKKRNGVYVNDEARKKNEELQKEIHASNSVNGAFVKVFGKEHNGYVRGLGLGVTPSQIFGHSSRPSSVADAKIAKMQSEIDVLSKQVAEVEALKAKVAEFEQLKKQFAFIMANIKGNHVHNIGSPNRQSAMLETTAAVHPGASGGAVLKRLHTRQFKYSFCLIGHMIEHLIFLYSLVV